MNNILGALTILFVGLKLTNHIDWSWFWVLSPAILGLILIVLALAFTIYEASQRQRNSWRR